MNKVKVDYAVELAYQWVIPREISDNANTPVLIFLHEGLGSIAQWKDFPQLVADATGFPALVYDRYGYGHSTPFFDKRKLDYLHREAQYFLPLLLEKLNLTHRPLILIGHSDGASIALIFAATFPKQVQAVVSIAAHVFVEDISLQGIRLAKAQYLKDNTLKEKLKKYHFNHVDSTFFAWTDTWLLPEFKHWNIINLLPRITAPVLAVQGENDEYGTEQQLDYIIQNVSHPLSKKILIPNCRHSPHIQAKQALFQEINVFLQHIRQEHTV